MQEVIADRHAGIVKGVIIQTVALPGRHLLADIDHISALHQRGVLLSVERQRLRPALRDVTTIPQSALEHPIQATMRRLWNRITRPR